MFSIFVEVVLKVVNLETDSSGGKKDFDLIIKFQQTRHISEDSFHYGVFSLLKQSIDLHCTITTIYTITTLAFSPI